MPVIKHSYQWIFNINKLSREVLFFCLLFSSASCYTAPSAHFPKELVNWKACEMNPVFTPQGKNHWDTKIRERGYIIHDDGLFHFWYTGYDGTATGTKLLGYATSTNGYQWQPHANNPIYSKLWTEDMQVIKNNDQYYMVAEGKDDIAHMLVSADGINWSELGPLDIRMKNGKPISAGPRGTPTLWIENDIWYLFYERNDAAVWLATSTDQKIWTHIQDEPVFTRGPDQYDKYAVAFNQIIKYQGSYYALYHAANTENWLTWSINIARSDDLIHWIKYPANPIIEHNKSSAILVPVNNRWWLYSMHRQVDLFLPPDASCKIVWQ